MSNLGIEVVVVVARYQGQFHWYRSDRELWVLDMNKWRDEFISYGHIVPESTDSDRFGIHIVNKNTAAKFLDCMSKFEIDKDLLSIELANRYTSATSWWDVEDLFPIMFVDFDNYRVGAFYYEGIPMERYIPDGWKGEFIDFTTEYSEEFFPKKEKFWVTGDSDLLEILIERDAANSQLGKVKYESTLNEQVIN